MEGWLDGCGDDGASWFCGEGFRVCRYEVEF